MTGTSDKTRHLESSLTDNFKSGDSSPGSNGTTGTQAQGSNGTTGTQPQGGTGTQAQDNTGTPSQDGSSTNTAQTPTRTAPSPPEARPRRASSRSTGAPQESPSQSAPPVADPTQPQPAEPVPTEARPASGPGGEASPPPSGSPQTGANGQATASSLQKPAPAPNGRPQAAPPATGTGPAPSAAAPSAQPAPRPPPPPAAGVPGQIDSYTAEGRPSLRSLVDQVDSRRQQLDDLRRQSGDATSEVNRIDQRLSRGNQYDLRLARGYQAMLGKDPSTLTKDQKSQLEYYREHLDPTTARLAEKQVKARADVARLRGEQATAQKDLDRLQTTQKALYGGVPGSERTVQDYRDQKNLEKFGPNYQKLIDARKALDQGAVPGQPTPSQIADRAQQGTARVDRLEGEARAARARADETARKLGEFAPRDYIGRADLQRFQSQYTSYLEGKGQNPLDRSWPSLGGVTQDLAAQDAQAQLARQRSETQLQGAKSELQQVKDQGKQLYGSQPDLAARVQDYRQAQADLKAGDPNQAFQPRQVQLPKEQQQLLDRFTDPKTSREDRLSAEFSLKSAMLWGGAKKNPELARDLADALAGKSQAGSYWADNLLAETAGKGNPRAQELLAHMPPTAAGRDRLESLAGNLANGNTSAGRELATLAARNPEWAKAVYGELGSMMGSRPLTTDYRNPDKVDPVQTYLQQQARTNPMAQVALDRGMVDRGLLTLKADDYTAQQKARQDILQSLQSSQPESREYAAQTVARTQDYHNLELLGKSKTSEAYDALAGLAALKQTSDDYRNPVYTSRRLLAEGGPDAVASMSRVYQGANAEQRANLSPTLSRMSPEVLGKALERDPKLAATLSDSMLNGEWRFGSADNRLQALQAAKTPESYRAIVTLGAHDTYGETALSSLKASPESRAYLLDAMGSQDVNTRRNAFSTARFVPYSKDYKLEPAEQARFLKASAKSLNDSDPKTRSTARDLFDTTSYLGKVEPQARREVYAQLKDAADQANPSDRQVYTDRAQKVIEQGQSWEDRSRNMVRFNQMDQFEKAALSKDPAKLREAVRNMGPEELRLVDERLKSSGQSSLVGELSRMRDENPSEYRQLLSGLDRTGGSWGGPGALQTVLDEQKGPAQPPTGLDPARSQEVNRRLQGLGLTESLNPAGKLAEDVRSASSFYKDMDGLYRERDRLAGAGQDTRTLQSQIDGRIADYEKRQFDSQGLQARQQAAQDLGTSFDALNRYADAHALSPREYDDLLMRSGNLAHNGNAATLDKILGSGLKPDEMKLVMEMGADMPTAEFDRAFSRGDVRKNFSDLAMREMRDFAQGKNEGLFERYSSRGSRLGSYLVDQGHGAELMMGRDGEPSVMDRLIGQKTPDSRDTANKILGRVVGPRPGATAESRLGQLYQMKVQDRLTGKDADRTLAQLQSLRRDPSKLSPEERRIQERLNPEVSIASAGVLSQKEYPRDVVGMRDADQAYQSMLNQIRGDIKALPESLETRPELKPMSGGLEASRQMLEAKKSLNSGDLKQAELALQKDLMLEKGMTHENIRGMMNLVLDSPTDKLHLGVRAKAGVAVELPFLGKAEAFVEGKAGLDVAVGENGSVNVSFDARIGAGAGASVEGVAGLEARKDGFTKVTYSFANMDEASKFVGAMWYDVQDSMSKVGIGEAPTGSKPTYAPPIMSTSTGSVTQIAGNIGPVSGSRTWEASETKVRYPVPWRAGETDPTQETTVHNVSDTFRAEVPVGRGKLGFFLEAHDQKGDKSEVGNGTTMVMGFDFGASGGMPLGMAPKDVFVDSMMKTLTSVNKDWMKRLPGADKMSQEQLDKAARDHLSKHFSGAQFKVDAKGKLEVALANPENLLLDKDMKFTGSATDVFQNWVASLTDEKPKDTWHMYNVRTAAELNMEASVRLRYGGALNAFVEFGGEFGYRNATTQVGSLRHGRMMLELTRPNAAFDETQLQEMEKDGLLHSSGRNKGTLNVDAFNYSLGHARADLMNKYQDPAWRAAHAANMSQEQFAHNLDIFTLQSARSMYAGLVNTGRTQQTWEEFEKTVNLNTIRGAGDFLNRENLLLVHDREAIAQYLKWLESHPNN